MLKYIRNRDDDHWDKHEKEIWSVCRLLLTISFGTQFNADSDLKAILELFDFIIKHPNFEKSHYLIVVFFTFSD